jgi:hypothetical protein
MGLELMDTAPSAMDGEVGRGAVIAQHAIRVLDARVLLEPLSAQGRDLPAGTVLAKVTSIPKGLPTLWCQLGEGVKQVCLSGSSVSGRFESAWIAESPDAFLGQSYAVARDPKNLAAPVAYRAATVAERPTGFLGYRLCELDGAGRFARFARVATVVGRPFPPIMRQTCVAGWAAPLDHSKFNLDGMVLTAGPGKAPDTIQFHVDGRIPPAATLAPLRLDQPPHAAGAVVPTPPPPAPGAPPPSPAAAPPKTTSGPQP